MPPSQKAGETNERGNQPQSEISGLRTRPENARRSAGFVVRAVGDVDRLCADHDLSLAAELTRAENRHG